MKKTLKIVLLAVAAIALLTGCDSMLESLFPDQTGQTTGASNTVTVKITGYDYTYGYDYYYGSMTPNPGWWSYMGVAPTTYAQAPIHVRLWDQNGNICSEQTGYFTDNFGYTGTRYATVTFSNVPDGSWSWEVWYDYNTDNDPTNEATDNWGDYYTYYDVNWNYNFFVSGGVANTLNVALYESYYSY